MLVLMVVGEACMAPLVRHWAANRWSGVSAAYS